MVFSTATSSKADCALFAKAQADAQFVRLDEPGTCLRCDTHRVAERRRATSAEILAVLGQTPSLADWLRSEIASADYDAKHHQDRAEVAGGVSRSAHERAAKHHQEKARLLRLVLSLTRQP